MARTSEQIDAIIAELKSNRDSRDTQFEDAARALDGVDDAKAKKLRGFKHDKQKAADRGICIKCKLRKGTDDKIRALQCTVYDFTTRVEGHSGTDITIHGLRDLLADESFSVPNATTVENL